MSKTEKITKLANAIRAYRGLRHGTDGKWIAAAIPGKAKAIVRYLTALALPIPKSMEAINNFKSFDEFREWIRAIDNKVTL